MIATLDRYRPCALALLRIVAGVIFLAHGLQKLAGFPPADMVQPEVLTFMWIGGVLELGCGLLIALGLLTRLAAFVASGEMAVAYWMFHAPSSFFPILNGGDAAILYCFVFLYLVFAGPGRWSLDRLVRRRART